MDDALNLAQQLREEAKSKKLADSEKCRAFELALQQFRACMSDALDNPATTKFFHDEAKRGGKKVVFDSTTTSPLERMANQVLGCQVPVMVAERVSSKTMLRFGNETFVRHVKQKEDCLQTLKNSMFSLNMYANWHLSDLVKEVAAEKGFQSNLVQVDVSENRHLKKEDPQFWKCRITFSWYE